MFNLMKLLNVCLAADDGGTGGAGIDDLIPPTDPPTDPNPAPNPKDEGDKEPAYFSQFSKEVRGNEDVKKALYGFKSLDEVANAYVQGKKDAEGSIRIPKKDSTPEDIKKFFTQLGMPEKAEDYELENYDLTDEEVSLSKDLFRKVAHQSALTKAQAKNLWLNEVAMAKAMRNIQAKQQKAIEDNFEPAYNKLLEGEFPVEAERTKAIKGEIDLIQGFLTETGLGNVLKANNFIYNAEAMHSLASYIKKHTGSFVDNKGAGNQNKPIGVMGDYSEEFKAAAGL